MPALLRWFFLLFPVFLVAYFFNNNKSDIRHLLGSDSLPLWMLILGAAGQVIFTFRFILQWLYSERVRESVLPVSFWIVSLLGSSLIITYAIIRRDPVLILGQAFGFIVYTRNIMIYYQGKAVKNTSA